MEGQMQRRVSKVSDSVGRGADVVDTFSSEKEVAWSMTDCEKLKHSRTVCQDSVLG